MMNPSNEGSQRMWVDPGLTPDLKRGSELTVKPLGKGVLETGGANTIGAKKIGGLGTPSSPLKWKEGT